MWAYGGEILRMTLFSLLALFAVMAYARVRSTELLLTAVGASLIAVVSLLATLFPPSATMDETGKIITETYGVLPWKLELLLSTSGLVILTIGVFMLVMKLPKK